MQVSEHTYSQLKQTLTDRNQRELPHSDEEKCYKNLQEQSQWQRTENLMSTRQGPLPL